MLTKSAIEGYKVHTERVLSHARYRIGSTWYNAEISRNERMADGRVAIYIPIIPQSQNAVTITAVQLYDKTGQLWAEKAENIKIESVQEGVLYRFTFDIHEEEV
ncbi:MAG: hypothetical protein OSJ56_09925 [Prevotella sp.]|nr:hypothetical protein [Prevotella sp.]